MTPWIKRPTAIFIGVNVALALTFNRGCQASSVDEPPVTGVMQHAASFPAGSPTVQDELIESIRQQALGMGTVADLNLPRTFLESVADRQLRSTFEDRFRVVVRDALAKSPEQLPRSTNIAMPGRTPNAGVRVIDFALPPEARARWMFLPDVRPVLRGFMPSSVESPTGQMESSEQPDEVRVQRCSGIVAKRLAFDGLLLTLAQVIEAAGPQQFLDNPGQSMEVLARSGFPVDFLRHFRVDGAQDSPLAPTLARSVLDRGLAVTQQWIAEHTTFEWMPTDPTFRCCSESGEHPIRAARIQLGRGDDWQAPGDGGNVDMARQLVAALPDIEWLASIERSNLDAFLTTSADWPWRHDNAEVMVCELPVSQWAQDNGKAGVIRDPATLADEPATLIPRFASRGDDGSTFVPGDTLATLSLTQSRHRVVHSSLLFQGGNSLVVTAPASGERILLLGEAEIFRNVSLGLSAQQVEAAFRSEFGVDRVEVLQSPSFHIDQDASVRAVDGTLMAFVNDPISASWMILEAGTAAMQREGVIDAALAGRSMEAIGKRDIWAYINAAGGVVFGHADEQGRFPLSLAEAFSTGPTDSAVGNFERVLSSLDLLMSQAMTDATLPEDRVARDYYLSLQRVEFRRVALVDRLRKLGFAICVVPGISNGTRSTSCLNGVHAGGRWLMPVWGGLFAELDNAAEGAMRSRMTPDVVIVPIRCAESQRRAGAVHCSLVAWTY